MQLVYRNEEKNSAGQNITEIVAELRRQISNLTIEYKGIKIIASYVESLLK